MSPASSISPPSEQTRAKLRRRAFRLGPKVYDRRPKKFVAAVGRALTRRLTRSAVAGLPVGVSRALADPIVKALMAADRVDPVGLEELLRRIAARLARHDPPNSSARLTGRKNPTGSASLVKLAKGFVLSLAVIAGLAAVPGPAAADDAATAFIRTIGTQAVSVIRRSDMPLASVHPETLSFWNRWLSGDF